MSLTLANKQILLGITGSIAAYKSADLVRRLREKGAQVHVAMTHNAKRFITPLTMQAVSGNPVHDDLFDLNAEAAMGHIALARLADIIVVAPASADFMARIANGEADDLLTTVCLASNAPLLLAPAMNQGMWGHLITQENLHKLRDKNTLIVGPQSGSQACGDQGMGRMSEPAEIVTSIEKCFSTGLLAGKRVLITAGPTHEAIDPVRYISNGSSGKMGYALAEAALQAGAIVTLVSGPVHLKTPAKAKIEQVQSAEEMFAAVMRNVAECDIFLAVAAVSDYRPLQIANQKLHKNQETWQLTLTRNPDIVASVGKKTPKPFIVGFAAETENMLVSAKNKKQHKHMDMIIANRVGNNEGMNVDENAVTIIDTQDNEISLPLMTKHKLAREIIVQIAKNLKSET